MSEKTKRLIGAIKTGQGVILQVRYLGLSVDVFLTTEQASTLERDIASARAEEAVLSLSDADLGAPN